MSTGCFSAADASAIAEGDQHSDEGKDKKPGVGGKVGGLPIVGSPVIVPDEAQRQRNRDFHAFGTSSQNASRITELIGASLGGGGGDLFAFGIYLHFLQDSYSHRDFAGSDTFGQARELHRADHTSADPKKAMDMARATFDNVRAFGRRNGCECDGKPDWGLVQRFIDVGYPRGSMNDFRDITAGQLSRKIQILGVPPRGH